MFCWRCVPAGTFVWYTVVAAASFRIYRRLHLPVNAVPRNMFSRDVKRLSFRCQPFNREVLVLDTAQTRVKGKMILINKKGRNYQKGVPLSTICRGKWKNLGRIILSQKLGEDLGAVSKVVKHYTSQLGGKTSKFDTWNSDVWHHVETCFALVRSRVDAIDGIIFLSMCKSFEEVNS